MATPITKSASDIKTETEPVTESVTELVTRSMAEPMTDMHVLAETLREQLISTVRQGQQLSLDATQTWAKAISVLPMADMPSIPGIPALPGVEAVTRFAFDLASDLLSAQRDYFLQLASAFVPEKTI